jgi:hypothetical protein
LPFFVTDFDCGRARRGGGFHPYPWRYRLYRNRRWLSGSLPAEKRLRFPCIQGGRRHRGGSFRIDTAARYSLLLGSSKISRLKSYEKGGDSSECTFMAAGQCICA